MIVSKQHGFIFLKTRKTAGTSIEIALSRVAGPADVITPISNDDESLRAEYEGRGPQNYEDPLGGPPVYNHVRARRVRQFVGRPVWRSSYRFSVVRNPWDTAVSAYFWKFRDPDTRPSFDEYVFSDQLDALAANAQIYRIKGRVVVHRLLRFEHLASDLREVWEHLDLPGEPVLPRAKSGVRPVGFEYRDMFRPETRDHVAKVFVDTLSDSSYDF